MSPEEKSSEGRWECSGCGKKFIAYEVARSHEKYDCDYAADVRSKEREKATKEKEEAKKQLRESTTQDNIDLLNFTYESRKSSRRFPTNTMLIGAYKVLALIIFGASIIIAMLAFDVLGESALSIIVIGAVIGINMLLVSEMIRFLMDFHDANYINTKVRIKTLEALQDISKKLRKR